jgi:hypothetical protein
VYLEGVAYAQLKRLARARKQTPAALVREAIAEYTARHAPRRKARSVAGFASGKPDLGSRSEALLKGFGEDR